MQDWTGGSHVHRNPDVRPSRSRKPMGFEHAVPPEFPTRPQPAFMNSQSPPDDVRSAIVRMTAVASDQEFKRRLDDLIGRLHPETILEGVVDFLDDADFKTRNTLGRIVRRLDRQRAVEVLNAVILNSRRSSQARLSAATLLETYLETEVETSYLEDVGDQNEVILASLREALSARAQFPAVLVEYARQFAEIEPDQRARVHQVLRYLSETDACAVLAAMALNPVDIVAEEALDHLGALPSAAAEGTLYCLMHSLYLHPQRQVRTRTLWRRLRFSGCGHAPLPLDQGLTAEILGFGPDASVIAVLAANEDEPLLFAFNIVSGITAWSGLPQVPARNGPAPQGRFLEEPVQVPIQAFFGFLHNTMNNLVIRDEIRLRGTSGANVPAYPDLYQAEIQRLWNFQPPEPVARSIDIGPWEGPDVHNWLAAHLPNATLARELNAGRIFQPLLKASRDWQVGQEVHNPVLGEYEKLYWWLEAHILIEQASSGTAQADLLVQVQKTVRHRRDELWSAVGQP